MRSNSSASTAICCWFSSRELVTDSHSPIAIEQAPATRPARPVNRIVFPGTAAPATPMTRLRLETSPSLAPSTAARSALPPVAVPAFEPRQAAARGAGRQRRGHRLDDPVVRALGAGRPPATASGCWSYWPLSRRSRCSASASTNCGPKRRASQASARVRHPGRSAATRSPTRREFLPPELGMRLLDRGEAAIDLARDAGPPRRRPSRGKARRCRLRPGGCCGSGQPIRHRSSRNLSMPGLRLES